MADRQAVVHARLSRLTGGFARYVTTYDELVPFSSEQLSAHRECIALRQQAGGPTAAVSDPRFMASLRRTLIAWGIGGRASYLVPEGVFALWPRWRLSWRSWRACGSTRRTCQPTWRSGSGR